MKKRLTPAENSEAVLAFCRNKYAFTLAEVLITLGIIGIVAALTMPSLIAKHQEKQNVVKLKKVYNTLSNAFNMAVNDNGTVDTWGLKSSDPMKSNEIILEKIRPYIKIVKDCGHKSGCRPINCKLLNGTASTPAIYDDERTLIVLSDGSGLAFGLHGGDCKNDYGVKNVCGSIDIWLNAGAKNSQLGRDAFTFWFTKNGIVPVGVQEQNDRYKFENNCNLAKSENEGWGCTAWVIFNENMDYLHCNDLSWDGKTKCK